MIILRRESIPTVRASVLMRLLRHHLQSARSRWRSVPTTSVVPSSSSASSSSKPGRWWTSASAHPGRRPSRTRSAASLSSHTWRWPNLCVRAQSKRKRRRRRRTRQFARTKTFKQQTKPRERKQRARRAREKKREKERDARASISLAGPLVRVWGNFLDLFSLSRMKNKGESARVV